MDWDKLSTLITLGECGRKIIKWIINLYHWRKMLPPSREIAYAFHTFSWHYLQQSTPTIKNIGQIERPEIKEIQKIWETTDTPILLKGTAGTGKSSITLHLAKTLSNEGMPVLFIRATDLPKDQDPIAFIHQRMPLSVSLMESFSRLAKERVWSFLIDQLDSVSGTALCKDLVSFIKATEGIENVKIMAVSRTYEAEHDPDISTLDFKTIECEELSEFQAQTYLASLGIHQGSAKLVELAKNLLNLSLIADIVKTKSVKTQMILGQVELWQQYFHTVQHSEGDEVAEFVIRLARETTSKNERSFPPPIQVKGIIRRLISWNILVEAPARRLAFRHEQLQDFLCASSLFTELPNAKQLSNEFGNTIPRNVISWLHLLYHRDNLDQEHLYVDEILKAEDYLPFYTRAVVLDNLRMQIDPSSSTAQVLTTHLVDWAYSRYFFNNLDNTKWIPLLYETGIFFSPPEPIETEPGHFKILPWQAGEYLSRHAAVFEDIVLNVVKNLKTQNWHAQETIIDALMKISLDMVAQAVVYIDTWLDEPFSRWLPIKLETLAGYLSRSGHSDEAIQILGIITKPKLFFDSHLNIAYSDFRSQLHFRSEPLWVEEFIRKLYFELCTNNPCKVLQVYEDHLLRAIELSCEIKGNDADIYIGYYWRLDIQYQSYDSSNPKVIDVLVDGFRDALAELCKQSSDDGRHKLGLYLSGNHLVFQRVALYTLRRYGKQYPELVEQALLKREYLEDPKYTSEYKGLLRDQFDTVIQETKEKVIRWILEGPLDIEKRAERHAQRDNREVTDEDRCDVHEKWILSHLPLIKQYLMGESLDVLKSLVTKHGEPDIQERPTFSVTTSWGGAPSPVSAEQLAEMSFDEMLDLFENYQPKDSFLNPRESLAQALRLIVQDNLEKYQEFAVKLLTTSIRYVYIYNYLNGIREGIKKSSGQLTKPVIDLCESVVYQKEDPFKNALGEFEPGLFAAQMEVARLLEDALHSDDPYLTRELLNHVRSLLIILSCHTDPEIEDESSNYDPFTQSINCVRGVAFHGIMHYSLYVDRQCKMVDKRKPHIPSIEPEIQEVLETKLDKTKDPSLAVHSVFGAFFPQLHYLNRDWAEKNLHKIFPDLEEYSHYWQAAWDAYIFTSKVYPAVFSLLISQYQRGLLLLSLPEEKDKFPWESPRERLAQHILFAYLNDLTDFGHVNKLLDLYFSNSSDEVRARGVFWLSKVLENEKPSSENPKWKKLWTLWQIRIKTANETDDLKKFSQEISCYMRWLQNSPIDLGKFYLTLQQSIKYLYDGFDAQRLVAYAAKHSKKFPLEAVTLLFETMKLEKEPWWTEDKDEEIILGSAIGGGQSKAKQIAIEAINFRGERGDFRWRKFIE